MALVVKVEVGKLDGQGKQVPAAAQMEKAGELRGPSQNLRFTLNKRRCVMMRQKLNYAPESNSAKMSKNTKKLSTRPLRLLLLRLVFQSGQAVSCD